MPIRIQYASDLHLEFRKETVPPVKNLKKADVLCLAGDICPCADEDDYYMFTKLIASLSNEYKYILHVAGNHEYYSSRPPDAYNTFEQVNRRLTNLEHQVPNYKFLNGKAVTLTIRRITVKFIGATLWTHIPKSHHLSIQRAMNDYRHIYTSKYKTSTKASDRIDVPFIQNVHAKHKRFVKKEIDNAIGRCVLITHHRPVLENTRGELSLAYQTDMSKVINNKVSLAIHGHTHQKYDKVVNGTRYVSNPRGYPHERTKFDPIGVILV